MAGIASAVDQPVTSDTTQVITARQTNKSDNNKATTHLSTRREKSTPTSVAVNTNSGSIS